MFDFIPNFFGDKPSDGKDTAPKAPGVASQPTAATDKPSALASSTSATTDLPSAEVAKFPAASGKASETAGKSSTAASSAPDRPAKLPPRRQLWYRASSRLPDDPAVHRYLLAYASDFNFLPTAMMPHGVSWVTPGMQVASLDHAMWFHRPFRFDEWLLYDVQSPSASGGRGLVLGRFYTRDGLLVASVAQEGLMRNRSASWAG